MRRLITVGFIVSILFGCSGKKEYAQDEVRKHGEVYLTIENEPVSGIVNEFTVISDTTIKNVHEVEKGNVIKTSGYISGNLSFVKEKDVTTGYWSNGNTKYIIDDRKGQKDISKDKNALEGTFDNSQRFYNEKGNLIREEIIGLRYKDVEFPTNRIRTYSDSGLHTMTINIGKMRRENGNVVDTIDYINVIGNIRVITALEVQGRVHVMASDVSDWKNPKRLTYYSLPNISPSKFFDLNHTFKLDQNGETSMTVTGNFDKTSYMLAVD